MKRFLLIIFCAMLSVIGMAQSTRVVKGMVMSVDEEPLSGVTIRVPGSNSSAVSSYDGRFEIKSPISANEIEASKDGYLDAKAEIDGTFIIFKLKLDRKSYRNKRSGGNAKRDAELEARLTALENANANVKSRQEDSSVDEKELEKKLRAKMEAEIRAELEAEIRAKLEAEEKARAEAAERARIEAEEKAKAEAAERARIAAEEKAKAEAAERARIAAEEKVKAEAAERARIAAEEKAKAEVAERARIEAEEKAKAEAAERARIAAEEKAKAEAAERARIAAEEKAKSEAAERARIAAEEKAKAEAIKRAKVEVEAVDLGLPSGNQWASCNLGASAPEERGDYFAWGETEAKVNYSEFNSNTRKKRIRRIAGDVAYDAAMAKLGAGWQMPTKDDFEELIKNCTWVLTTVNGVDGFLVTGYTGNSIFLPTTGYRDGMSLSNDDRVGEYWTSTPHRDTEYAYYLCYSGENYYVFWNCRYVGRCIRPVKKK